MSGRIEAFIGHSLADTRARLAATLKDRLRAGLKGEAIYHSTPVKNQELRIQPGEGGAFDYYSFGALTSEQVYKGVGADRDVVALFELHCFDGDIVPVLLTLANEAGIEILVEGWATDINHRPLDFVGQVMAHAEVIESVTSTCTACKSDGAVYAISSESQTTGYARLCPDCRRKQNEHQEPSSGLDHIPRFEKDIEPLTVVCGPPYSGRSDFLFNHGNKAVIAYPDSTKVFRPSGIGSRWPQEIGDVHRVPVSEVSSFREVFANVTDDTKVLILDMIDLFPDINELQNADSLCSLAHERGMFVVAYGCGVNEEGLTIHGMARLLSLADRVIRLRATCHDSQCINRENAIYFTRTKALAEFAERFVVDKEGFRSMPFCREHFQVHRLKTQ